MKVTAEPTEKLVKVDGVPCRAWRAVSETGAVFVMLVHRVAVPYHADQSSFEAVLRAMPPVEDAELDRALDQVVAG